MRRLALVALMLSLAALTGCGDDEPSGSPSGAGFAKEGNADCKAANATLAAAAAAPQTAQQFQTIDNTLQALLTKIDDLVPSDAEQNSVYQLLDGYRAIDRAAQAAGQSLTAGAPPAAVSATFAAAAGAPKSSIASAANQLGAPDCANPPLPSS
jgi:hypothetical protein